MNVSIISVDDIKVGDVVGVTWNTGINGLCINDSCSYGVLVASVDVCDERTSSIIGEFLVNSHRELRHIEGIGTFPTSRGTYYKLTALQELVYRDILQSK